MYLEGYRRADAGTLLGADAGQGVQDICDGVLHQGQKDVARSVRSDMLLMLY